MLFDGIYAWDCNCDKSNLNGSSAYKTKMMLHNLDI